jgi:predicted NBD/HSP70 family sugar kinase
LIYDEQHSTTKQGARSVAAQVMEIANRVKERARTTHERLMTFGISTPGVVDQVTRRVTSLAYNVSPDGGLDPVELIGARFNVPVLIENNVNLAAIGESWHGLAHGVSTFAFVAVGAGVGMGLVIDGELVHGAHGAAGEIAYLPSGSDPFDERHRLHGGLEDKIGAERILAAFRGRSVGQHRRMPASAHEVQGRPITKRAGANGGDRELANTTTQARSKLSTATPAITVATPLACTRLSRSPNNQ